MRQKALLIPSSHPIFRAPHPLVAKPPSSAHSDVGDFGKHRQTPKINVFRSDFGPELTTIPVSIILPRRAAVLDRRVS